MDQEGRVTASLEHIVHYPKTSRSIYPAIVALHGRGTDANDLLPLIHSFGLEDFLVIAPRAPLRLNLGFGQGYAWYDIGAEGVPDARTFHPSLELLSRFLAEVRTGYPADPQRLILLGFSQGTVMAYAAGLTEPGAVRAIVGLSGYVPQRSGLPLQLRELDHLSVFISHGAYDEIVPVQLGRESAKLLKKAGADVVYREYPMGHEVTGETVHDITVWMKRLMP